MEHEIGQAGAQVLDYLSRTGEASALRIRSDLKLSQTLLFMALGSLSREGKIDIIYRDRAYWAGPKK